MTKATLSRRKALCAAAAACPGTYLVSQAGAADHKVKLSKGQVILFQGDSITDAGRDRKWQAANDARSLGRGYPAVIASALLSGYPELNLQIHNRGISGNKVPDLESRWQVDCLDLKPNILSILIGVNDIWHRLNGRYDGTPEVYRDGFSALLEKTRKALPDTKIVICEPFVLRCGAVNDTWFPEFETRRKFAREVAEKAGTIWVSFQSMFDAAIAAGSEPAYWAADGVHPSVAGHGLMAKSWMKTVRLTAG